MNLKPIETYYKGYRFRSRLEARWAVFFDSAKIKYFYEPEGFKNDDGSLYLPDFYLPDFDTYVEVKANIPEAEKDLNRYVNFIKWGGPIKRLVILSDIPSGEKNSGLWHFPCLAWDVVDMNNDSAMGCWFFFYDGYSETEDMPVVEGKISNAPYLAPFWFKRQGTNKLQMTPTFKGGHILATPFSIAPKRDTLLRKETAFLRHAFWHSKDEEEAAEMQYSLNCLTFSSFKKAKEARFKHGEKPI